jgi:hypothetical protein
VVKGVREMLVGYLSVFVEVVEVNCRGGGGQLWWLR